MMTTRRRYRRRKRRRINRSNEDYEEYVVPPILIYISRQIKLNFFRVQKPLQTISGEWKDRVHFWYCKGHRSQKCAVIEFLHRTNYPGRSLGIGVSRLGRRSLRLTIIPAGADGEAVGRLTFRGEKK